MLPAGSSAFAVRGQRPSNNDAFAAKYASIEPWKSRWSCERLVNPTAASCSASSLPIETAIDDASSTHAVSPASSMRASSRCRSGASGVVSASRSRAPPTRASTVPSRPLAQARRLEHRGDQKRRRRLPVGAGHADDGHVLARPAGDHVRERPERLAYPSRAHLREPDVDERALDEQRRGPSRRGLGCQLVAVLGRPGHAGEERPGRDGVEAQREVDDLDSVEPRERLEGSAALRAERG